MFQKKNDPSAKISPVFSHIDRARKDGSDIKIILDDDTYLIVMGRSNQYLSSTDNLERFIHQDIWKDIRVSSAEAFHFEQNHPEKRDLAELLWHLAYHQSAGGLLPGCRRDDVIKLIQWPNFTRLPKSPESHRIAALFSRRATSIVLASRILDVAETELHQFYSASMYAGYMNKVNRAMTVQTEPRSSQELSIVRKLMRRLARAS